MSGHSKWATTKRQKAIVDAKRGKVFTKIGNMIAIAAHKGTDPAMNPALALAIDKAKAANMPQDNIKRAIQRAADKNAATMIEETYEAYGPGGLALIIEIATDNKNRTFPEVKSTLTKHGGRLAEPGSVFFQFARKGVITLDKPLNDDLLMELLDSNADDAAPTEDANGTPDSNTIVYTKAEDLMAVRQKLLDKSLPVLDAELQYIANAPLELTDADAEKAEHLLDALDDLDDIQNLHTNLA
ncbi:MAG: YebC/PmpR family DNA-binding transcriptional regulator [Candidatus Nomurabacteria bacterium]|jgi:YebC/PmpR family DNA-binding regulatory protein|nr:YebC/PmpR family DNA-binding transcriptional regulator [Candidatus Nomurabacteria bacterium]